MEGRKKRLLLINSLLPYPITQGIDARVINLLESLSRRFEVDLVCRVGSIVKFNDVPQVERYCHHVEAFLAPNRRSNLHRFVYRIIFILSSLCKGTPHDLFYNSLSGVKKKILNLIRNNSYDIVFFEYWFWDKKLIQVANGLKVIDTNDVQFMREGQIREQKARSFSKPFTIFQINRYMKMELEQLNLFDLIIATTEEDKETFRKYLGSQKNIVFYPTGADTDYFSLREIDPEGETLIFYGAMAGFTNIDGVLHLYNDIMPLIWKKKKDVKLIVLGNNPPKEIISLTCDPRITVTGYVQDIRDYLAKGNVVTLPLRFEYGHRGRIFEIMAMGIPIVVTPQAIKGMGLRNGEGLLIEGSPISFAQTVLNILEDRAYAKELGLSGRKIALERFSKQATYDRLTDFLFEYLNR